MEISHRQDAAPAPVAVLYPPVSGGSRPPLDECLAHMLNQIDYGMLLVDVSLHVHYANGAARRMLVEGHPLQHAGGRLEARRERDATRLRKAIDEASRRRLRTFLDCGEPEERASVAVVPAPPGGTHVLAILVLGKSAVCEGLTAQWFARNHGLTAAETQVLELLSAGRKPAEIARLNEVAISTVRTQVFNIRAKTGTRSVSALVREVATLPPLVNALAAVAH